MALQKDNIGAQAQDGIMAKVGMTFLPTDRTILVLPLEENCPTDPDEMVISGSSTFSIESMFKHFKDPETKASNVKVDVDLGGGEPTTVRYGSMKDFEPESVIQNVPALQSLKEQLTVVDRLKQLMQEEGFQKIVGDAAKKQAMIDFLRSVVYDIEQVDADKD